MKIRLFVIALFLMIFLAGCSDKTYIKELPYADYNEIVMLHLPCTECRYGSVENITFLEVLERGEVAACGHEAADGYDVFCRCNVNYMQRCAACGYVATQLVRENLDCLVCYEDRDFDTIRNFEIR